MTYLHSHGLGYGFVQILSQTIAGEETLGLLHSLTKDGKSKAALADELESKLPICVNLRED